MTRHRDNEQSIDTLEVRRSTRVQRRSLAKGMAAIMASYDRAPGFRPARQSDAATGPKARAGSASIRP